MHRLTLGDFELNVFSDGTYPLDGGAFFGVIPKVMWSKRVSADENNYVTAGLNSLVIRTGEQTVLVETGMGNKLSERMRKFYGQPAKLLENLSAAGIAPEDIDIVINSHLHFDHCGWNTVRDKNGKIAPTFPEAKYYAPEGEWQYARKPSDRDAISYIPENYDPLVESGQMTLLKGGEEVVPGISVRTFRGHTASMQGIIVLPSGAKEFFGFDGASEPRQDVLKTVPRQSQNPHFSRKIGQKWGTHQALLLGSPIALVTFPISCLLPHTSISPGGWGSICIRWTPLRARRNIMRGLFRSGG